MHRSLNINECKILPAKLFYGYCLAYIAVKSNIYSTLFNYGNLNLTGETALQSSTIKPLTSSGDSFSLECSISSRLGLNCSSILALIIIAL